MPKFQLLQKTATKTTNYNFFGFDIETFNENKSISLMSLVSKKSVDLFFCCEKDSLFDMMQHDSDLRNSYIVCTNLGFDYFGLMHERKESNFFRTVFRGGSLIQSKAYVYKNKFTYPFLVDNSQQMFYISFIDTMNFAPFSVKKIGEFLNIKKLEIKEIMGTKPQNIEEWLSLIEYNIRDSFISMSFAYYLQESFNTIGACFKNTIANTAMKLFTAKYIHDEKYYVQNVDDMREIIKAYHGGRCEAFCRGKIEKMNYYDVNSLYPSVMKNNVFPNPNTHRVTHENKINYIMDYDGVSFCRVYMPYNRYPVLPFHYVDKVLFPCGEFSGYWSHVELREALKHGLKIMKIYKTHYYLDNCTPFKEYVEDLYNIRKKFKKESNPMELVVKLLLNSLYGKFGQHFDNVEVLTPFDSVSALELTENHVIERLDNYLRMELNDPQIRNYSIPIWAVYITSYARLKLFEYLKKYNAYYCDTDSIITKDIIPDSTELGKMKLEMTINEGVIVRPKFYGLKSNNGDVIKIKGLSRAIRMLRLFGVFDMLDKNKEISYDMFLDFVEHPKVEFKKFAKFRESLRRGFIPNEEFIQQKYFTLEDNKRYWDRPFNALSLQDSKPVYIKMNEGEL